MARSKQTAIRLLGTDFVIALLLFALIVASWLPRMNGPIDLRWDGGAYYVLGTALAEGKGYRLLNEPGEIWGTQYPPLLPAIIAAHQLLLGTSDPVIVGRWLRLTFFLMFTAYILVSFYVLRRWLPLHLAALASLICLLQLFTHFMSDLCFAEIPFALTSVLFVWLNATNCSYRSRVLAGALATATYLLRTAGIALFLGWIAESLAKKDFKNASLRLVIALIPILVWQSYIAVVESRPSYTAPAYTYQRADYLFYNTSYARNVSLRDPFNPGKGTVTIPEVLERFVGNMMLIPVSLGEAVSAKKEYWSGWIQRVPELKLPSVLMYVCPGILGTFVIGGILILSRRGEVLVPVYILTYVIAVCLTPWPDQWTRYWTPLTPFFALSLILCLLGIYNYFVHITSNWLKLLARASVAAVFVVVFSVESLTLFSLYTESHQAVGPVDQSNGVKYRLFFYFSGYRDFDDGLDWVKLHSTVNDVVVTSIPHWAYLRTGRRTVMPPFESDPQKTQELLDSIPAKYVIVDKTGIDFVSRYTLPLLRSAPDRWTSVYKTGNEGLEIYERVHRKDLS